MVVGEGAGILVLESLEHALKRNAKIYAEFSGFGSAPDSNSSPTHHHDGSGKEKAMRRAVQDAHVSFSDLSGLIANGSGLREHDNLEKKALDVCVPAGIPVATLKPLIGHAVYGAGGIESAAAVLSVHENRFPGSASAKDISSVMINSFGFCGQNTALVFRKFKP
jgi:3-oxoacyl-[acyl-carrier-protein] synthase II